MKRLLVPFAAVAVLSVSSSASAGVYHVKACSSAGGPTAGNESWVADVPFTPYVATYTQCPGEGITTRMSGGPGTAPYGAGARHAFTAPPGTRIVNLSADIKVQAERGWYAGFVDNTPRWIWCGGSCSTWGVHTPLSIGMNTPRVFAQVTCGNGGGCSRAAQYGIIAMRDVDVTVADDVPPSVAITGGSVTVPGWHRGDQDVRFSATDATGIRSVEVHASGGQRDFRGGDCSDARPRPCHDEGGTMRIPAHAFGGDGRHLVTVRTVDGGHNAAETSRHVLIDRTPPAQALDARADEGDGWRPANGYSISWTNPEQTASPITAAYYSLCPASNAGGDGSGCVDGVRRDLGISAISDIRVPKPGEWRLALWLEDEAGNADRERAAQVGVLRFDEDAPELRIAEQSADDPTRVRVVASDATSGIAAGQVEARRTGEGAWRSLPTALEKGGFSATIDDEVLPRGRYELRARAVDRAGNERTTEVQANGEPATRTLPLRISTRLAVGRPHRVAARNANGKKRYRTVLRVNPRARFGRTIPLSGRLTMPGGNPLAGADVEIWERVKLPSADWRRVSVVRTTRTGRFRFKALRGPSRTLKFRYPGTTTIRARSKLVELGVRAVTSMRANRRSVVNGEEIRFHGRLKGRQTGEVGKLLYLQVYTRGRWSTFATPRANHATGLWSQPYRFTATRGLVRYRFRALIPREASFPYETGRSRPVKVTVRGL